jgi:hypothetical protein
MAATGTEGICILRAKYNKLVEQTEDLERKLAELRGERLEAGEFDGLVYRG